jgi:membrane protein DedA with SNARE-associated domain
MVIAATLLATQHHISPILLGVGVAVASFCGDLMLLGVARRAAAWAQRRIAGTPGAASTASYLLQALNTKRGRTIVTARFLPGGRTVLDLAAGTARNQPQRFLQWSAVSAMTWAFYIVGLGYLNEKTFNTTWLSFAVSCLAATTISAVVARLVQRERREQRLLLAADGEGMPEDDLQDNLEAEFQAGLEADLAAVLESSDQTADRKTDLGADPDAPFGSAAPAS